MDVMTISYDKIKSMSPEGFLIFLGMVTDQFGSDHGLSSEETCQMLESLVVVQKEVHVELGSARPVA